MKSSTYTNLQGWPRKERGIIFKPNMVRAILNVEPGSWPARPIDPAKPWKWQTRRVVRPPRGWSDRRLAGFWRHVAAMVDPGFTLRLKCLHGSPGEGLWVREAWAAHRMYDDVSPRGAIEASWGSASGSLGVWYRADPEGTPGTFGCPPNGRRGKWRPSIFMPREASRLALQIEAVAVERLQEIHARDVMAEGLTVKASASPADGWGFAEGWDAINGKRAPWDTDPWVWVISFQRLT